MSKFLDSDGLLYFWQKIKGKFDSKVDVEIGKGLSTNDFTNEEKIKLQNVEAGAQVNVITGVKGQAEGDYRQGQVNITADNIGLGNVDNYKQIRGLASGSKDGHILLFGADGYTVRDSGFTIGKSVPPDAAFTDTTYEEATALKAGLLSSANYSLLSSVEQGANKTIVDTTLSTSSVNPVQNKVITEVVNSKLSVEDADQMYAKKSDITDTYKYKGSKPSYDDLPSNAEAGDVWNVTDTGKNYAWTGTEWDDLGGLLAVDPISNTDIDTIVAS